MILGNYKEYHYIIDNARKKFQEVMNPEHLAVHLYNMFKGMKGITT